MNNPTIQEEGVGVLPVLPAAAELNTSHVEKIGEISNFGVMDQAAMEIVDTATNEHYMLLVDATATLQTVEPQIRVTFIVFFVIYRN